MAGNTRETLAFAGRGNELKKLKENIASAGFSMVMARRGMGRTALLKEFANQYSGNRQYKVFYADVSDAVTPAGFILAMARQVLNTSEPGQVKQMRDLAGYFTYLKPVINFNKISGTQQLDFSLDENFKAGFAMEQMFGWLARQSSKVIVVLDDFQQLMYFRDQQFASFLNEVVKQHSELRIIATVVDSKRFSKWKQDSGVAVLKNADVLQLAAPEFEEFKDALTNWYSQNGKKVNADITEYLIDWCRGRVSLVLALSDQLLHSEMKQPDTWQLEKIFADHLQGQREIYQTYRRLLTSNQWLLLRGIAREKGAQLVMSGDFVRKYGLGSASSVQTALDALYDKELIYEEDGSLYLEDVGLSRWLEV